MSAHQLFCYQPHRRIVEDFIHEVGGIVSRQNPHSVHEPEQLRGMTHISFIIPTNHPVKLPEDFRRMLVERGALIISIDDSFERIHAAPAKEHA